MIVPVFDAKQMVLNFLLDPSLINEHNFAEGYDVWTGMVKRNIPAYDKYGEVHSGNAWLPAQLNFICLPPKKIHKDNVFDCVVLGRHVRVKVWIHFFIGDTEGNNKWLGQYPGNREGVKRPFCDCNCTYHDLSNLIQNAYT